MKKVIKIILSVLITACFSAGMFYCFVAGAPAEEGKAAVYMAAAAGFSILSSLVLCAGIHIIRHLHKKLDNPPSGEEKE